MRITQVDSYVSGQESYRTDVALSNGGGAAAAGALYRAGDCYLQESDTGFGFVDTANRAVGCSKNANNTPAGRIEQWYPITDGNAYMEGRFSEVWAHIATHTRSPTRRVPPRPSTTAPGSAGAIRSRRAGVRPTRTTRPSRRAASRARRAPCNRRPRRLPSGRNGLLETPGPASGRPRGPSLT